MSIDPVSAATLGPVIAVQNSPSPKSTRDGASEPTSRPETIVPQARAIQVDASFGEDNRIIYRIVDKQTGDLIEQIPPQQLLALARSIRQLLQAAETQVRPEMYV